METLYLYSHGTGSLYLQKVSVKSLVETFLL